MMGHTYCTYNGNLGDSIPPLGWLAIRGALCGVRGWIVYWRVTLVFLVGLDMYAVSLLHSPLGCMQLSAQNGILSLGLAFPLEDPLASYKSCLITDDVYLFLRYSTCCALVGLTA